MRSRIDDGIADAHAAPGLAHLRRNEWVAAREQFERALTLDAQTAAALEGLACLLVDAGRYKEAAPFAAQAVAIQPQSVGANECFSYTLTTTPAPPSIQATPSPVRALEAMLAGDNSSAEEILQGALSSQDFNRWADPLLRAADNRRHIPEALQAVTLAASEQQIDPSTEILCWRGVETTRVRFQSHVSIAATRRALAIARAVDAADSVLAKARALRANRQRRGPAGLLARTRVADVCSAEPALYGCKMHPSTGAKPQERR